MKSPLVFFNVGWMREYRGILSGDQIVSGGTYIAEHRLGGEILNFLPIHGRLYGCVQTPHGGQVNLKRLGGMPADEYLDGVTIVWTARRPEGGTVVVGWYRNARIYPRSGDSRLAVTAEVFGWAHDAAVALVSEHSSVG